MQSIQEAVGHFGQGARILEENMARIAECWSQMERAHFAQRTAEERWRQMEDRLGTVMEERWRLFEDRLEAMVMEKVEAVALQRLEAMVMNAVDVKVGEKFAQVERELREQNGDRETGEAICLPGAAETFSKCGDVGDVQIRLTKLESSVQKALDVMFPRVQTLLTQIEEQSSLSRGTGSSLEQSLSTSATSSSSVLSSQSLHQSLQQPSASTAEVRSSTQQTNCAAIPPTLPTPPSTAYSIANLIAAAKEGKTNEVKIYLDSGIPVNTCDSSGNTALYWTAFRGHNRTLSLLLQRGADVNCKNTEGWTPLHAAARWGLTSCISLLLDAGAAIESRNARGRTPLHIAAHSGRDQSVQALMMEGAQINARDIDGRTPCDMAMNSTVRRLFR